MNIREAEKLSGVSSRNIRFYEQKGLLKPARNAENDYREYFEEEIRQLKLIRTLRMVDMPLEQIREVLDGKLSLSEAAAAQRDQLIARTRQLETAIALCTELSENQDLDAVLQRIDVEDACKHLFRHWWQDYLENTKRTAILLLVGFLPVIVGWIVNMAFSTAFVISIVAEVCTCLLLYGWGSIGYFTTLSWGNLRKNTLLTHSVLGIPTLLLFAVNQLASQVSEQAAGLINAAKYIAEYPFLFLVPYRLGLDGLYEAPWILYRSDYKYLVYLAVLMLCFLAGGLVAKYRAFREEKKEIS